jgi:GNAT superfamily N-acetyltransferase
MLTIGPVTTQSSPELIEVARALFTSYGEFLRASGGPALLCFSRLEHEIATLPATYLDNGGEVLIATEGAHGAGCIAYRSVGASDPGCCEIKRLFVSPEFRGQGLGKRLVSTALERARHHDYRTALLDTEPHSMAVAKQIYLDLGFEPDLERNSRAENSLVTYLRKSL